MTHHLSSLQALPASTLALGAHAISSSISTLKLTIFASSSSSVTVSHPLSDLSSADAQLLWHCHLSSWLGNNPSSSGPCYHRSRHHPYCGILSQSDLSSCCSNTQFVIHILHQRLIPPAAELAFYADMPYCAVGPSLPAGIFLW